MSISDDQPQNTADLRGPGEPDEAEKAPQYSNGPAQFADPAHPERSEAANIREEQQAHAPGTVPPSYVGSGEPAQEPKPEEALKEPEARDADA